MWLNLLVLLMLVLIAFFQSLQGLFAAMILLVLSIISSVVAFGFYEDLYKALLADWLPAEGQAVSLMVLFLVTLLVLRLIVDFGIKGDVALPPKVDRIGGGILGFFVAMVMTGMTVTAIQMLPFDREVLGFARAQMVNGRLVTRGVWFGADSFATGLAGLILNGSMSGKTPREGNFEDLHPNLLGEVDARRSAGVPLDSKPDEVQISLDKVWSPERVAAADGSTQLNPGSGAKFLALQVKPGGNLPRAFTPLQMRLVGVRANRVEAFPLKAAGAAGEVPSEVQPLGKYGFGSGSMNQVYEIPTGLTPLYVTFDGKAYAAISENQLKDQTAPSLSTPAAAPEQPRTEPKPVPAQVRNPTGRTHGADITEQPVVSDDWPEGLSAARNEIEGSVEIKSSRLLDGHLVLPLAKTSRSKIVGFVSRFEVPSGQRLVQVPLHRVQAGSLMGQAIDFAVRTLQQNWTLVDDAGTQYMPVGAVAIASTGGEPTLEIQYRATQENLIAGHTLAKWRKISDQDLKSQPDAKLFFLYLVPPGKHIIRFDTGRQMADLDLKVD